MMMPNAQTIGNYWRTAGAEEVVLGRRTHIPRVTLLMLIGQLGLEMLPAELEYWYKFLTAAALAMVAFPLGGALSLRKLKRHGREILTKTPHQPLIRRQTGRYPADL
jgi:hypothetical protein